MNDSDVTSVRPWSSLPAWSSLALARHAFDIESTPADVDALRAQAISGLPFLGGEGLEPDLSDPALSRLGEHTPHAVRALQPRLLSAAAGRDPRRLATRSPIPPADLIQVKSGPRAAAQTAYSLRNLIAAAPPKTFHQCDT